MRDEARIVGVLLAAGRGARFDPSGSRLKLLERAARGPHIGEPLAVAAARTLRAEIPEVVAVVAPPSDTGQAELHRLLRAEGCTLAVNPRPAEGQGASIVCGIVAASPAAGWIIALADMPAIQSGHDTSGRRGVARRRRDGRPGPSRSTRPPVGFAATMQAELLASAGDAGARAVLLRHPPRLIEVDDPGVLYDVDTPEDR